ncbi:MAG: DUF2088 domain-containing protein [Leptospiraceae bacterium]|nr:DUF2088 domain-containing protein [Leptospiraceae bacterium]
MQNDAPDLDVVKQVEAVSSRLHDHHADTAYVPDPDAVEDPEVVYIHEKSAKRVTFSGEDLVEVALPPGSRVIYPRTPRRGLSDVRAAIRYALLHPEGMEPLPRLLKEGMKVTIAVDDISLPLPPMRRPDLRQLMLEVLLDFLGQAGVSDIHIIVATAFHRRMTEGEIRRMVGNHIYDRFSPDRLYNHDGENRDGMKWLGHTEVGEVVEINRRAAESDLIIYVNINFVPMNGGHKSVATGLAGYRTLREHHDPEVIAASNSYMDPGKSALADANERIGSVIEKKLKIFHIESAVNNRMFSPQLSFLSKNEDDLNVVERQGLRALRYSLSRMSAPVKRRLFQRVPAPYECIAVHAGEVNAVHNKILRISKKQYVVNVKGQADVLLMGIPFVSPYSVNSILNPLLVQVMALGYLYHLYDGGVPLLKDGGVLILFHPCRDEFDARFHPSYIEFFHRLLPESTDSRYLQKKYEVEFATNPEYIKEYREGYAYHGVHPFYMWYWGETGRRRVGQVIAVGAEHQHVPERMGWENAATVEEALLKAYNTVGPNPQITMLHQPPVVMTRCV